MSLVGDAIAAVVKKVTEFIPGRVEGLKNEKVRLLDERSKLQGKKVTPAVADRIIAIDTRLSQINELLINNARD